MREKVIVVSGGAGGIGAEVSSRLSDEGAQLVIADINGVLAEAKAADLGLRKALGVACEITKPEQCESAASAAIQKFGRIDGVVNCAGISGPHDSLTLPPADWARMIDVQLNGAFYFIQACAKHMMVEGGAVVFITSTNAEAAFPRRAAVVRNNCIAELMRHWPIDIHDANRRELVWQSLVMLGMTDQFVCNRAESLDPDRECRVRGTDAGGRHCSDSSTHGRFVASAIHSVE